MADDEWDGDRDAPRLDTLAAVKVWLDHAVAWVRSLKGTRTETAAIPLAARTIRNFYRALDRLGVCDRPKWPDDPADVEQAEAALCELLVWVRRHLPKPDPYSGCTLFVGEGIRTLGNLRAALLSEEQTAPLLADMFQQCSGDQERALQALKMHQELTGDFRSFPIVQRADAICRQRYGQPLTKEHLDRIRLEYHEKTGEPFGAVNNERLRDVLDVVEKIPVGDYPLAFAGLPVRQPAAAQPSATDALDKPATGGSEHGEGAGKSRAETLQSLSPTVRKAYLAYELVESTKGNRLEDQEAYDHLHENGLPDNAGDLGELNGYELPAFDTWARYVREARQALGEQKYNRRAGRQHGRSIANADEVERREKDK